MAHDTRPTPSDRVTVATTEQPARIAAARSVARAVQAVDSLEGAGFLVHRPFPTRMLSHFDPFLLLDQFGPVEYGPGEAVGAPDHPHRGFETVTYILEGRNYHEDSQGHSGILGPGDVQWMTAGSGIVHSEVPEAEFSRTGGRMNGFQLWVNLPTRDKMMNPRYQEVPTDRIPVATTSDGAVTVRVIAGEALGARAVIDTRTPIMYLHYTLQPGATVAQPVPADFNVFAYVIDGEGTFGADQQRRGHGQMVIFDRDGDVVEMSAPTDAQQPLNVLLIGGVPINEPIARYGPFVMNTEQEIRQAINDYRDGKMGAIQR
jgi:redox-sensitive bicupin YhaK (pirin superfamily)